MQCAFLAPTMLEELCKRINHCCVTLRRSRNKKIVGSCWFKSLTGFKLCATTPNNMQQGQVCKQTLHVTSNNAVSCWSAIGSLSNDDRDGKENGKKLAKQQLYACIMLFCTFLCRRCTTTKWNCLISRSLEDVNTRQRTPFSFPELWYGSLEFNSRKIRQHLTKWTRRNKRD